MDENLPVSKDAKFALVKKIAVKALIITGLVLTGAVIGFAVAPKDANELDSPKDSDTPTI